MGAEPLNGDGFFCSWYCLFLYRRNMTRTVEFQLENCMPSIGSKSTFCIN